MAARSVPQQSRVAIYARVSTSHQSQDPTLQTRELREYCDRRGWQVTGEYVDVGISGSVGQTPGTDCSLTPAAVDCTAGSEFGYQIG